MIQSVFLIFFYYLLDKEKLYKDTGMLSWIVCLSKIFLSPYFTLPPQFRTNCIVLFTVLSIFFLISLHDADR